MCVKGYELRLGFRGSSRLECLSGLLGLAFELGILSSSKQRGG